MLWKAESAEHGVHRINNILKRIQQCPVEIKNHPAIVHNIFRNSLFPPEQKGASITVRQSND
jgi:hypothetical protein